MAMPDSLVKLRPYSPATQNIASFILSSWR